MKVPGIWKAMEWIRAMNHQFIACRKDSPKTYIIDFDSNDFLNYVPVKMFDVMTRLGTFSSYSINYFETQLFRQIDGTITIRECIERAGFQGDSKNIENITRKFIRHAWRVGYIEVIIPKANKSEM